MHSVPGIGREKPEEGRKPSWEQDKPQVNSFPGGREFFPLCVKIELLGVKFRE